MSGFFTDEIQLTICDVRPPVPTCPSLAITVVITPANDNEPIFSQDVYHVTLPVDTSPGAVIINVSCTDIDVAVGQFKNVTTSSASLKVTKSQNGLQTISLTSAFDVETPSELTATLTCFDTGNLSTTALLILIVTPAAG